MSEPIKVFWIEPTGKIHLRVWRKDTDAFESAGIFDNKESADVVSKRLFAADEIKSAGFLFVYRAIDGREFILSDAPPGAMWDASSWMRDSWPHQIGPDGICLMVVCPDGWHWCVDSQASNCTRKGDHGHKCWIRHGDPRTGNVHVDKAGETCSAGAGSIQTPKWHGFLHHGHLVTC